MNSTTKPHSTMLYIASFSELWERFSFYIVEALLIVYLIDSKHLTQAYSYELLGTYIANSFILTIVGSYFGQNVIGFRGAVNLGAFLMSVGYMLLLNPTLTFLHHALALIVVGSAFFKPNMACFVGSLYKIKNDARYCAAYNIYYACVMIGVILSTSISGYILELFGWDVNFSLASICMAFAFAIFLIGNRYTHNDEYVVPQESLALRHYRWPLTALTCILLWVFMHIALRFPFVAQVELIVCALVLFFYFSNEIYLLSGNYRRHFIACIVLMFFSGVYWALLFQLFFSFNLMVKLVVNRHFFQFEIPSPVFMGVESFFVIIFSSLLGQLWTRLDRTGKSTGLFSKYVLAFIACSLGLLILAISLKLTSTPWFLWVVVAYTLIGLGEAILAPSALAMIAQLNQPAHVGVMMAALYVFWGFGTKMADLLAQWSVFPSNLIAPTLIAPYFYHAIVDYFWVAMAIVVLALIGRKLFRL